MRTRTRSTFSICLLAAAALALAASPAFSIHPSPIDPVTGSGSGTQILVPPGADALISAIAAAGKGGTVTLQAGLHTESATVVISKPVSIVGEPGAILEAGNPPALDYPLAVAPVIDIKGANSVSIKGIHFQTPSGTVGNTAVLIEDSNSVVVSGNTLEGYQFGIINQRGNNAVLNNNSITVAAGFFTGDLPESHGIVNINGRSAQINGNSIGGGAAFGVWACDRDGTATDNTLTGGFVGLILCKVPEGNFLISGGDQGSASAANGWVVQNNLASFNLWGYLVIDGSNNNRLSSNDASNNDVYDMELVGDTYRFGYLGPSSFENTVNVGSYHSLVIKDCGRDNRIIGSAQFVDTNADPCY
jgi:hypothetical protein